MYHYRVKYSAERRGQTFTDTVVISSPYSLNDSYADATFVLHQIRFDLQGRSKRKFKIHQIEVTEPLDKEPVVVNEVNKSADI